MSNIETAAVLTLDDDIGLTCDDIELGFRYDIITYHVTHPLLLDTLESSLVAEFGGRIEIQLSVGQVEFMAETQEAAGLTALPESVRDPWSSPMPHSSIK